MAAVRLPPDGQGTVCPDCGKGLPLVVDDPLMRVVEPAVVAALTCSTVLVVATSMMLCPVGPTLYVALALADAAYNRWFGAAG